jgi:hypothetical protein
MSEQPKQQQPNKKPEPPAPEPARDGLMKVEIKWLKGGHLKPGKYDPDRGIIFTERANRPVMVSVHSGVVEWWAPV